MTTAVDLPRDWVPADSLAARVAVVQVTLGMNRKEFALFCGLTENQLLGIERGRSVRDEAGKVQKIAKATGASRDWLMWGGPLSEDGPKPAPREVRPKGFEPLTF